MGEIHLRWGIFVCVVLAVAGCSTGGGSELPDPPLTSTQLPEPDTRTSQWRDAMSQEVAWVDDEFSEGVENLPAALPYGTDIITNGSADASSVLGCRYIFIVGEPPYKDVHGVNKQVRSKTTVRVPAQIDGKHVWKFRTVGCQSWSILKRSSATSSHTPTSIVTQTTSRLAVQNVRTKLEQQGFSFEKLSAKIVNGFSPDDLTLVEIHQDDDGKIDSVNLLLWVTDSEVEIARQLGYIRILASLFASGSEESIQRWLTSTWSRLIGQEDYENSPSMRFGSVLVEASVLFFPPSVVVTFHLE